MSASRCGLKSSEENFDNTNFAPLNSARSNSSSNVRENAYTLQHTTVELVAPDYDEEALIQGITEVSDESFYVIDLGCIRQQVLQWRTLLPRVVPYYAVKCNPNPVIIRLLAELGTNFDCASVAEIQLVQSMGVSADRIIFANPCKFPAHIRQAQRLGVNVMTFDNADELDKIAAQNPFAEVVLRIATDDSRAMCRFSTKFGAQPHHFEPLVAKCVELGLKLIGVSFHVGSGSSDDTVYPATLRAARTVFDIAAAHGFELDLIDIGGGFPGVQDWNPSFPQLAAGIRPALDELFPAHVRVVGEPGRYMVARSHALAVNVYARRLTEEASGDNVLYYVDDGVYGSFSCIPFDHQKPRPQMFADVRNREQRQCTVFGPTCDSMDCIAKDVSLPLLQPGDWLYFREMGAYTTASSTKFNGFFTSRFHYIDSDRDCCAELPPLPAWAQRNTGRAAADCSSDSDSGAYPSDNSDSEASSAVSDSDA